jgi:hypothetical protein
MIVPSTEIILKGLLDKCSEDKRTRLLKLLSDEQIAILKEVPASDSSFSANKFSYDTIIDKVHYSWFLPTLKSYPQEDQHLFLQALNPYSKSNLEKFLKINKKQITLTKVGKLFFRQLLLFSLLGEKKDILPLTYLPSSSLNILLNLSKYQLVELIDFLSLYDLASELNQIVAPKILKKIYNFLTSDQKKFLKSKMPYKELISFPPLEIKDWDGEKKSLQKILHKRGIYRLSQSLCIEHPSLIWYACHELDIGRGSLLFKLSQKKSKANIAEIITNQILEIIEMLEEKTD